MSVIYDLLKQPEPKAPDPAIDDFSFQRTYDWAEIKRIITHPDVFHRIGDDTSTKREDFEPWRDAKFRYIQVMRGGEVIGLWILVLLGRGDYQARVCLLPEAYGTAGVHAIAFPRWVWINMPLAQRLFMPVPVFDLFTMAVAKSAGMIEVHCDPKKWSKDGAMHDVMFMELNRPPAAKPSKEIDTKGVYQWPV